jgi:TolB-like protein/Flp pilus assembly protein TadD
MSRVFPPPEAVLEELHRVLDSPPFATAARSRRFLTYVVEQTLAGQSDAIKEIVLASEVFDRPTDFDPRVDTIVRVEAGKLRKRLEEYYASSAAPSAVRIEMPKGSYVPRFVTPESNVLATPNDNAPALITEVAAAPAARGRRKLIAAAIAAVAVVVAGVIVSFGRSGRSPSAVTPDVPPAIAVLPFQNFSSDPNNEYLADGLAEDLTDALVQTPGLRVASRTSAFLFKGQQADVRDIGVKLNVGYVIEGSVRREGERLKVSAQLVRTDDGYHVWSRGFERDVHDVLAVQDEIARAVVDAVQVKLSGNQAATARPHVPPFEAFDLYLRGVDALARADVIRAEELLQRAIAADPKYSRPYVAVTRVFTTADIMGGAPRLEMLEKARRSIRTALELEPTSADAHVAYGSLLARHDYQWEMAETEMRRALALDPNSSAAHNEFAQNVLAPQERWDEAMAEDRQARELDPLSPSLPANHAFLLLLQRKQRESIEFSRAAVAKNPNFLSVTGLGMALFQGGEIDEAERVLDRGEPWAHAPMLTVFRAYAYARAGRGDRAQALMREVDTMAAGRPIPPTYQAIMAVATGDPDTAFRHLVAARERHESPLIFLRVEQIFDPLRSDPRFAHLLADVGLSDADIARRRTNRDSQAAVHP